MKPLRDVSARTWNRIRLSALAVVWTNIGLEHFLRLGAADLPIVIGVPIVGVGASAMHTVRRGRDRAELQAAESAETERKAKWHDDVYRVAYPDPAPGQCPVCGLDDLIELAQRDAYLELAGTPAARVVSYGPLFAHQECAEIAPYLKYYHGTREERHHRGFHHDTDTAFSGCAACVREINTGTKDPHEPPPGCMCAACKRATTTLTAANTSAKTNVFVGENEPDADPRQYYGYAMPLSSVIDGPWYWKCHYCVTSGAAHGRPEAEAALKDHAKKCPDRYHIHTGSDGAYRMGCRKCEQMHQDVARHIRQVEAPGTGVLNAMAEAGFSISDLVTAKFGDAESQRLARIKGALAPNQDPTQWLYSAVDSPDPGVREAAWAAINRMRGIM